MKKDEIKYIKQDNKYIYTCPHCGYIHKIDNEFYIYDELKKGGQVQDRCFHCDEMLYMEAV